MNTLNRSLLNSALTLGMIDLTPKDPVIGFKQKAADLGGKPLSGNDPHQKREAEEIRAAFIDYFDDKAFAAKCISLLPKAVQWKRVALQGFLVFEAKARALFDEMADVDRRLEDMRYNASNYSAPEFQALQNEAADVLAKSFDLSNGLA